MLSEFKPVSQEAIDNALLVKSNLWAVKNLFDPETLTNIAARIEEETNWHPQEMQEHLPRFRLDYNCKLHNDIHKILQELNFSKHGLKYETFTVWKDTAGYIIREHYDNDSVIGAMQIYLNDAPANLGTWFEENEFPFVKNTGYIMNNQTKLRHGMRYSVPNGITRTSIYAYLNLE